MKIEGLKPFLIILIGFLIFQIVFFWFFYKERVIIIKNYIYSEKILQPERHYPIFKDCQSSQWIEAKIPIFKENIYCL